MTSPLRALTLSDLVAARIAVERCRNESGERADYRRRKYDALAAAFAAKGADPRARQNAMEPLFDVAVGALAGLEYPFSGYLEAPRPVTDLHRQHAKRLRSAIAATEETFTDFLVDAYAALWQIPVDQRVDESVLADLGPAPDDGYSWSEWDDLPDDW